MSISYLPSNHTKILAGDVTTNNNDVVRAYFGMRKISLGRAGPGDHLRPLLNNRFEFHMGLLDQVIHCSPCTCFLLAE